MKEQVWWYATRAAGLMTLSTAVASVIVGVMLSTHVVRSRTGPWAVDLHRFLGGLTVAFLLLHLGTLWAGSYVEFAWQDLLVPGESQYRPRAVAWGVVSAWILFAVEVTSILRRHVGQMLWRVVHWMSPLVVAAGTVHALEAGSDADNPLTWVFVGIGSIAMIVLGAVRLRGDEEPIAAAPETETEILEEMRERLAELPGPDPEAPLQSLTEATSPLPRRAVAAASPTTSVGTGALLDAPSRTDNEEESVASIFSADPFSALPEDDSVTDVGSWPGPSANDPFAATAPLEQRTPRPFIDPAAAAEPAVAGEARSVIDVGPAPMSITARTTAAAPRFVPAPTASVGPPPLPEHTLDPDTGEPDEEAYRKWLVKWLAFAEQYGDETPSDPIRF